MSIAFLVPCLNEERSLARVLYELENFGLPVFVIDDGSTDRTLDVALANHVRVVRHDHRLGKGNALISAWAEARSIGHTGVITVDGDGQHRAEDIAQVLAAAIRSPATIVVGARLKDREQQPWHRHLASRIADRAVGVAAGQIVTDSQSGLRYYPDYVFGLPRVPADHFVFESAVLVEASRQSGTRIGFVSIRARYTPTMRPSHFRPVWDLLRIASYLTGAIFRYAVFSGKTSTAKETNHG